MEKFTRKDFYFSIITGFITGFIAWRVFIFLELPEFASVSYAWLIVFVPVLLIFGVYFGILNTLIYWSDINRGLWYSVFVALAFIIGTTHSYFWNKFWVFDATDSNVSGQEFSKFLGVSVIAGLINVGIASGVVNLINPLFELTLDQWANIGGVARSSVTFSSPFFRF